MFPYGPKVTRRPRPKVKRVLASMDDTSVSTDDSAGREYTHNRGSLSVCRGIFVSILIGCGGIVAIGVLLWYIASNMAG